MFDIDNNTDIQDQINQELENMDPEEREALLALDAAADRYMIIKLRNAYGVEIRTIPNDRHHILVDGVRMGYEEFAEWLWTKQSQQELPRA